MERVHLDSEFEKGALIEVVGTTLLEADLIMPNDPIGVVLIALGMGSSRLSPRNRFVASTLREGGLATLLLDTETPEEKKRWLESGCPEIDLHEMSHRIKVATDWLGQESHAGRLPIGYHAAGGVAAAVLMAAAGNPGTVRGIVARGGRPDLASDYLADVCAPTLLIVGARDTEVLHHNREALDRLGSEIKLLEIIPGATHVFGEPGTLSAVAMQASRWFARYLPETPGLPTHAVIFEGP